MSEEKKNLIEISCDRPSHVYRLGEKARFTISTPAPGTSALPAFTLNVPIFPNAPENSNLNVPLRSTRTNGNTHVKTYS